MCKGIFKPIKSTVQYVRILKKYNISKHFQIYHNYQQNVKIERLWPFV